jgi:hypothetical protein
MVFWNHTKCGDCSVVVDKRVANKVLISQPSFIASAGGMYEDFYMYYCPDHKKDYDIRKTCWSFESKDQLTRTRYYKTRVECDEKGKIL